MWHDSASEEEQILANLVLRVEYICVLGNVSGTDGTICTAAWWQ
jgi:hypothetical protein